MTKDTEQFKGLDLKLQGIISEVAELVSDSRFVSVCPELAVHELSDGYAQSVNSLANLFMGMAAKKAPEGLLDVKLMELPVVHNPTTYPEPMILISDDMELDANTREIVRIRRENGYQTFPVIIFSDNIFKLAYGENFAYMSIIETFENVVKEKVMVFRKSEFKYIEEYLMILSRLMKVNSCRSLLDQFSGYLNREIRQIDMLIDNASGISGLVDIIRANAILKLYEDIRNLEGRLKSRFDEWNAEILKVREVCDKEADETILGVKLQELSPFVVNIDLKYGVLRRYIQNFLGHDLLKGNYDFLNEDIKNKCAETQKDIAENVAKLSLIGTFSSGKTTLINTFLGKRDISLRTSMGHNTAVLMELFYEPSDREYYDINYKEKLMWSVVKPDLTNIIPKNSENTDIKIISVEPEESGNLLIQYAVLKTKEKHCKRVRASIDMAVKQGDILKPGDAFVRKGAMISKYVTICSAGELRLIKKLAAEIGESGRSKLVTLDNGNISEKKRILDLLNRIEKIAKEKSTTIPYNELCKSIGLQQGTMKPDMRYSRIVFECGLKKENERKVLDRKGWIALCGMSDQKNNVVVPAFSEQPECYMLAKNLQLHVHAEFLQYCTLTDTPGFGSVTEEHDAISEQHIRDDVGRLLVMIAINAKTVDAKYQDLINNINDVYDNFRSADKANVVFLLNCFTNLATIENIKKHVDAVSRMLVKYGFKKQNIFVCNLKNALDNKQQTEVVAGYPSYDKFHDFIIQEMISNELRLKYQGIQNKWERFFTESDERIDGQISYFEKSLSDVKANREKIQKRIKCLDEICIDPEYTNHSLLDPFEYAENILLDAYLNTRKGIFIRWRRNEIERGLETVKQLFGGSNDDMIAEDIRDYYTDRIDEIAYISESRIDKPAIHRPYSAIAVLEIIQLRNVLMEADNETHWYDKGEKNDYYAWKVREIIGAGKRQSLKNMKSFSQGCCKSVSDYKKRIISENEGILKNMQDESAMKARLESLNDLKNNFSKVQKEFRRIQFV